MSGIRLVFPGGTPPSMERIFNPDVIFKKVKAGLGDIEKSWTALAARADDITHGRRPWWKRLFGTSDISPEWLHHYLYQKPSTWPVNKDEQKALRVLRRLRQLGSDRHSMLLTREMKANPPTDREIKQALGRMAADTAPLLKQMDRSFWGVLNRIGAEIEPLCDQVYGEPCEPGEGAEIALADIRKYLKSGVTGLSGPMEDTLREWLFWRQG